MPGQKCIQELLLQTVTPYQILCSFDCVSRDGPGSYLVEGDNGVALFSNNLMQGQDMLKIVCLYLVLELNSTHICESRLWDDNILLHKKLKTSSISSPAFLMVLAEVGDSYYQQCGLVQ